MELNLIGKKVVVTGATRGIGKAISEMFAQEGCELAICSRNNEDLNLMSEKLSSLGSVNVISMKTDITKDDEVKKWLDEIRSRWNDSIDIIISNISSQSRKWVEAFNTDLSATTKFIDAALPMIKNSDHGSITFIASQSAMLGNPSYKAYPAIKAALIHYMFSLSRELAPSGIRVNAVSPGEVYFKGGIWDKIKQSRPEKYQKALDKNILGRLATPEDVAQSVIFLSSSAASFISGINLLVDGASREHVPY